MRSKNSTSWSLEVMLRGINLQHWGSPGTEASHAWGEMVRGQWVRTCTEPSIIQLYSAMPEIRDIRDGTDRICVGHQNNLFHLKVKEILSWTGTTQQTRWRTLMWLNAHSFPSDFFWKKKNKPKQKKQNPLDIVLIGSQLRCHFWAPNFPLPHPSTLPYPIPALKLSQLLSN